MESLCFAKLYYFVKNATSSQQNADFCYQNAGSRKWSHNQGTRISLCVVLGCLVEWIIAGCSHHSRSKRLLDQRCHETAIVTAKLSEKISCFVCKLNISMEIPINPLNFFTFWLKNVWVFCPALGTTILGDARTPAQGFSAKSRRQERWCVSDVSSHQHLTWS